jgi:hypothetical protein
MGYGAWGEAAPVANRKGEFPSSYYTNVKGVKVLRRPKSIMSAAEASGWKRVYEARLGKAVAALASAEKVLSPTGVHAATIKSIGNKWLSVFKGDLSALKPEVPGYKAIRAALAQKKDATIRIEWFKNCLRYTDDLWTRTQRVQAELKPSAQTVAAAQAAASGAVVSGMANASLAAEIEKLKAELAAAQAGAAASATAADTAALADVPEVTAEDVEASPEVGSEVADDAPAEVVVVAAEPVAPVVAATVSKDEPKSAEEEASFLSKYGMYIGGAVALGVGAYWYHSRKGAEVK